ncbi:MAG: hypothetical protein ACC608_05615 [Anaerofustis sp.]
MNHSEHSHPKVQKEIADPLGHSQEHNDHGHHEHAHLDTEENGIAISVTTHDSSVVGSYRLKTEKSFNDAQESTGKLLEQIASRVNEFGGLIGHIKAIVKEESDSCILSVTDTDANRRILQGSGAKIEGVAIVFGITPQQLQSIMQQTFGILKQ